MNARPRTLLAALALATLTTGLAGCFNPFDPLIAAGVGVSTPKPEPNTPTGVVELFRWCWVNRAIEEYREVFTADYVFTFATTDSAGNTYRDENPWRREDELIMAENMFVTGKSAEEPAATSITLDFGSDLRAFPDGRAGKNSTWHRQINVGVLLLVDRSTTDFEIKGDVRFYVVRGDSAIIPPGLGLSPDPTRWYIEGWEDYTLGDAIAQAGLRPASGGDTAPAARPTGAQSPFPVTWGRAKLVYR